MSLEKNVARHDGYEYTYTSYMNGDHFYYVGYINVPVDNALHGVNLYDKRFSGGLSVKDAHLSFAGPLTSTGMTFRWAIGFDTLSRHLERHTKESIIQACKDLVDEIKKFESLDANQT